MLKLIGFSTIIIFASSSLHYSGALKSFLLRHHLKNLNCNFNLYLLKSSDSQNKPNIGEERQEIPSSGFEGLKK